MMEKHNVLVTGGAGFIGSNLLLYLVRKYPHYHFWNVDLLTYAGNLQNLREIEDAPNYHFVQCDIADYPRMKQLFLACKIDWVLNLAAESHVDRSIKDPFVFAKTNVMGTLTLLQVAKEVWIEEDRLETARFYHISTDEVYGSLAMDAPAFTEQNRYEPHSPYSASKASSDHFVRAFYDTYHLPVLISNCSNNYGPFQFPEKFLPLMIHNIKEKHPIPVYGRGEAIRDWLYVGDHVEAIDLIMHKGRIGETYNIGGGNEWKNIDLVHQVINSMDRRLGRKEGASLSLITYVTDRLGHDMRYAIDARKISSELGWKPRYSFQEGLEQTIEWYLSHEEWLAEVTSGAYQQQ